MAMLETRDLTRLLWRLPGAVRYRHFTLGEGETVAIIGANGAGKSTFLKSVAGLMPRPAPDSVRFDGRDIGALPACDIVKLGIALVPEGRRLFSSLSVEENLLVGGYGRHADGTLGRSPASTSCSPRCASAATPRARRSPAASNRWSRSAAALMSNPRVLLCDEISLGLAPIVIRDIYRGAAAHQGSAAPASSWSSRTSCRRMAVADRVYCFQEGRVSLAGRPQRT